MLVAKTFGLRGDLLWSAFTLPSHCWTSSQQGNLLSGMSTRDISKCLMRMVGRGTSAPNLPERVCLGPQGSLRVARRSKVEGLFESVFFRVFLILLGVMLFTVPPNRGLGQSPKLIRSSFQLGRHFSKFLAPDHDKLELLNTDSAGL